MGGKRSNKKTYKLPIYAENVMALWQSEARPLLSAALWLGLALSFATFAMSILFGFGFDYSIAAAITVGICFIPFSAFAHRWAIKRLSRPHKLHLRHVFIGKKDYAADEILSEKTDSREAALLLRACSIVSNTGPLTTQKLHPADIILPFEDAPDVITATATFGPENKPYVFMAGAANELIKHTDDIWDFGHVRSMSANDRRRLENKAVEMQSHRWHTFALAYAPLPKTNSVDPLQLDEPLENVTLLGLAAFDSTREKTKKFTPDTAKNMKVAAFSSVSVNTTLASLVIFGIIARAVFDVAPVINVLHVLFIKLAIELLPTVAVAWDQLEGRRPDAMLKRVSSFGYACWNGLLIASLATMSYIWVLVSTNAPVILVQSGSGLHERAVATAVLTVSLCLLASALQLRSHSGIMSRYQLQNIYVWIAVATSVLMAALAVYYPPLSGMLRMETLGASSWLLALTAAAILLIVRELQRYADTDHPRDDILELLRSR